jgi:hypothetical protein
VPRRKYRQVDLCPQLAALLKVFGEGRHSGLLFANKMGKPLSQTIFFALSSPDPQRTWCGEGRLPCDAAISHHMVEKTADSRRPD